MPGGERRRVSGVPDGVRQGQLMPGGGGGGEDVG